MKTRYHILSLICVACVCMLYLGAPTARGQDLDDDITGGGDVAPFGWEPMIAEFFAIAPHGQGGEIAKPQNTNAVSTDVLGEANQWAALKPLILPKGDATAGIPAVDPAADIISAWQRVITPDGK